MREGGLASRVTHCVLLGLVVAAVETETLAAQTLQASPSAKDSVLGHIQLLTDANVKNVMSQPGDVAKTTTGMLGMLYFGPTYSVTGLISVAGSSTPLTTGFGASFLVPASGTGLSAGLLEIRRPHIREHAVGLNSDGESSNMIRCANVDHPPMTCNWGWRFYLTASSAQWQLRADTVKVAGAAPQVNTTTAQVPAWGSGIGLTYMFFNGTTQDNNVASMLLDFGLATRHLRGDLTDATVDTVRARLLGTTATNFGGIEVGLTMSYNLISAGLTYYHMAGSIKGFSRGQVVAGISVHPVLKLSADSTAASAKKSSGGTTAKPAAQPPGAGSADSTGAKTSKPAATDSAKAKPAKPAGSTRQ